MTSETRKISARTIRPDALTGQEISRWRAFQAAAPALDNPLLGPEFAKAVGARRADARISIFSRNGTVVGFLAHHARPGGFARPIGAPFCDYHALICEPGALTIGQALAAAGIRTYRFDGLVDPFAAFGGVAAQTREAYAVRPAGPAADYLEALRAASPKRFKNMRRLEHKLEREVGQTRLVAPDHDAAAFETMIEWKRAQFRQSGIHDVLRPDWALGLMRDLFETRGPDFSGLMVSLYAGETLVGAHFGVRAGGTFHPWLASTNPELGEYSPGQTFMLAAIAGMDALGLTTFDLGLGHDHYKRPFVREPTLVGQGMAGAGWQERAWTLAGSERIAPVGRLRRRLDHIAAVELTAAGRARGVVEAFAGRAFRPVREAS